MFKIYIQTQFDIFRFLWPCMVSKVWRERKPTGCNNQMFIINFCLNTARILQRSAPQPLPTTSSTTRAIHQNAVTHGLCSPEDGHNNARNMLRQKLIINIWLLHPVGFLSLHTLLTMHGHSNLKQFLLYMSYENSTFRTPFMFELHEVTAEKYGK